MKTLILITWGLIMIPFQHFGQGLQSNLFIRTPQVVNYNLKEKTVVYDPVISAGGGLSLKKKFIEFAMFINSGDIYGYYTFFGTNIKTRQSSPHVVLSTNWFGEITYLPSQGKGSKSYIYTSGLCFIISYAIQHITIGLPICTGIAYNGQTLSWNSRMVLNVAVGINSNR